MVSLLDYANPVEAEYLRAYEEHGTFTAAGDALEVHRSTIQRAVERVKARADASQWKEVNERGLPAPVLDLFTTKRISRLEDADGTLKQQWVIAGVDAEKRRAAIEEAYRGLAEDLPRERTIDRLSTSTALSAKLINLFTLTDCHVGMLAWHREGGADWDLKICEDTLVEAFRGMIARSPVADTAVINQLGDFLHFDGLEAVTPTNRHALDADGRFHKISRVAVRILRRVINMALETHETVHVICAEGNHDIASSNWLAIALEGIYETNPRVTIDDSPLPFYSYQFGKTMLCFHHGHCKKGDSLPLLFAQQFRKMWGATEHTYVHMGHQHHVHEWDQMGVRLQQHATLAARDAYAARHGYLAARQALAITYHAEFGEWSRSTTTPDMLVAA